MRRWSGAPTNSRALILSRLAFSRQLDATGLKSGPAYSTRRERGERVPKRYRMGPFAE